VSRDDRLLSMLVVDHNQAHDAEAQDRSWDQLLRPELM
jgi:hypothetical protein